MDQNLIECEKHGTSQYCIICRHLREKIGLEYFAIQAEPAEPAQAWCAACDHVLEQERGWSDVADQHADWELYCSQCYAESLETHKLVSWVEGSSPED
ncbi:MAG: hypothetical protein V4858_10315 [Pseudomonadota bacterium]